MRIAPFIVLLLCSTLVAQDDASPHGVIAVSIASASDDMRGDHILTARIAVAGSKNPIRISTRTFMTHVRETLTIGGTAVILGSTQGSNEVVAIDLQSHRVSRALAYNVEVLADRWMVSVEWYPDHLFPPQYANDVVLVRDLTSREGSAVRAVSQTSSALQAMVHYAGKPVFPRGNADDCSYQNVQEANDVTTRVYPKTFVMVGMERLVFVASSGKEGSPSEQYLVSAGISSACLGSNDMKTRKLTDVSKKLNLPTGEALQIDRVSEVSDTAVRLTFTPGAYSVPDLIVQLP